MPKPVIYIQCGDGVLYPFDIDEHCTFGVVPLDSKVSTTAVTRSYLLNEGEGHSHAVVTANRDGRDIIPLNSGTEQECHQYLHWIAAALTQAGAPAVMTKPVTYGQGEMPMPNPEDQKRWGGGSRR